MAAETQTPAIQRFGTFEADLRTGELRKQGKRIKLQERCEGAPELCSRLQHGTP